MPYISNRVVHDADSHTMELPNWYKEFGTKKIQDVFKKRFSKSLVGGLESLEEMPKIHKRANIKILNLYSTS